MANTLYLAIGLLFGFGNERLATFPKPSFVFLGRVKGKHFPCGIGQRPSFSGDWGTPQQAVNGYHLRSLPTLYDADILGAHQRVGSIISIAD